MEDNKKKIENENQKKYMDFFIEQFDSTTDLLHEMNKDYVGIRVDNIKQKREFLQNLVILSGSLIGLSSIFGYEKILNSYCFIIGFSAYFLLIISIISYFRETLDKEGNGLLAQQDRYNVILNKKRKIIEKYLKNRLFTEKDIFNYLQEVESSEEAQSIKSEMDRMEKGRIERLSGKKQEMDFSGELFVFLFIFASFFIFLSFFFKEINLYLLLSAIILMVGLIFTDSITFFTKKISKLINFIKK